MGKLLRCSMQCAPPEQLPLPAGEAAKGLQGLQERCATEWRLARLGWLGVAMLALLSAVDAAWQASACACPACRLCASFKWIQFTGCLQLHAYM